MNTRGKFAGTLRGFTLVELLVAAGITAVLSLMLLGVLTAMLRGWALAGGGMAAAQQAELALDQVTRDIKGAVAWRDGSAWLVASIEPDQSGAGDAGGSLGSWSSPVRKPGAAQPGTPGSSLQLFPPDGRIVNCRFGMAGVWLRFITTVPDKADGLSDASAPRAIGYQIVRRAVGDRAGAARRYALFRSEVRPYASSVTARDRSTFIVGHDLRAVAYNSTAGGGNLGDAGTIRRPRRDQLLANDVIDFGIRFTGRASDGSSIALFPAGADNRVFIGTSDSVALVGAYPAGATTRGFPNEAELFVRVLTGEGARRIEALENGMLPGVGWWDVAMANSVVLTRRVHLEACP